MNEYISQLKLKKNIIPCIDHYDPIYSMLLWSQYEELDGVEMYKKYEVNEGTPIELDGFDFFKSIYIPFSIKSMELFFNKKVVGKYNKNLQKDGWIDLAYTKAEIEPFSFLSSCYLCHPSFGKFSVSITLDFKNGPKIPFLVKCIFLENNKRRAFYTKSFEEIIYWFPMYHLGLSPTTLIWEKHIYTEEKVDKLVAMYECEPYCGTEFLKALEEERNSGLLNDM